LAAACAGLQAGVWNGWFFAYIVLLLGLAGRLLLLGLHYGFRERSFRVWQGRKVREGFLLVAVFYVAAGVFVLLAGADSYFSIPYNVLEPIVERVLIHPDATGVGGGFLWPDTLSTVGELAKPDLRTILVATGGPFFFCVGLLGLLLLG